MTLFLRYFFLAFFCSSIAFGQSAAPVIMPADEGFPGTARIAAPENSPIPIELPVLFVPVREIVPVRGSETGIPSGKMLRAAPSMETKGMLDPGAWQAFSVDAASRTIGIVQKSYTISPEAVQALDQAPVWLRDQLEVKLRVLNKTGADAAFAQLILDAPENMKDEVAFCVANMSVSTMLDSRFSQDKQAIIRNAEWIYRIADSLKYVRLVEHGSYTDRDYYTTTSYRVYDPVQKDTIWTEIPRDYYYWYIVHPKMDQEGVYVKDNGSDASGQRTYGYSWREFIWNNPDPAHDYTQVNITTSKGTVSTIPRFGELLKNAPILWDRQKTYLPFNRNFTSDQSALDVIGNWASRAVPVDVTLPRAFQPNQILMKHNGMCNEDAFLIAGACRTALIPVIYLGSWAEDHAFGSIWDQDWNHYEFFRGGLAPSGNSFYGITNMLDRGSYGWKTSMVEGFRPDGFPEDFSAYYANTATVNVTVTDSLGAPIDGAMVQVYANYLYGSGYQPCGHLYTNRTGKVSFKIGEAKQYLVNVFHPLYKWSPKDSTQAFYLIQGSSTAGATYNVTVPYPTLTLPDNRPAVAARDTGDRYVHIVLNSTEIISGVSVHDAQKSRFYKWNTEADGMVEYFVCDSLNFELFQSGRPFSCQDYTPYLNGGNCYHYLPDAGQRYFVFRNSSAANILERIDASCEILEGQISGIENVQPERFAVSTSPSPVHDVCMFRSAEPIESIQIMDLYGRTIRTLTGTSVWQPGAEVPQGVYFARVKSARSVAVAKIVVTK